MAESTALAQKREVVITLDQIRPTDWLRARRDRPDQTQDGGFDGQAGDRCRCSTWPSSARPIKSSASRPSSTSRTGSAALVRVDSAGIDGFRAIADRSGCYAGSSEPVFRGTIEWPYKGGKRIVPEYAQVTVWKIVANHKGAFTGEARWVEFVPDENNAFMWAKMPRHMLAKCAEAQALRKAFSLQLGSMPFSADARRARRRD